MTSGLVFFAVASINAVAPLAVIALTCAPALIALCACAAVHELTRLRKPVACAAADDTPTKAAYPFGACSTMPGGRSSVALRTGENKWH